MGKDDRILACYFPQVLSKNNSQSYGGLLYPQPWSRVWWVREEHGRGANMNIRFGGTESHSSSHSRLKSTVPQSEEFICQRTSYLGRSGQDEDKNGSQTVALLGGKLTTQLYTENHNISAGTLPAGVASNKPSRRAEES